MALLAVPAKQTSTVDIVKPLKNFIKSTFGGNDGKFDENEYNDSLSELNQLRTNAVCRKLDRHTTSLDLITRYYDQLVAIEHKLPIAEGQITINFCWYEAFDKGGILGGAKKQTGSSGGYEKICVLYNIAALQSQIAATQNLEDEDGLKTATKLFQQSSGIFKHLAANATIWYPLLRTSDLSVEFLTALSSLMLAQAQECILTKARQDKLKDTLITKLASAGSDLYAEAMKQFQLPSVKSASLPSEWLSTVAGKQALMHAYSEFHQSKVCHDTSNYGEEIARLAHAINLLKAAETRAGGLLNIKPLMEKFKRTQTECEKDNNMIYNAKIPHMDSLKPASPAQVAKALEPSSPMSENFKDLFEKLVPLSVHNAVVGFKNKKGEISSREIAKIRESTQLLNTVLASLNLPAAIEDLAGEKVPQSVLDKSNQIKQHGGLEGIDKLFQELPELLQRNTEILNETIKALDEEAASDNEMRTKFKEKWIRHPSEKLTTPLRTEGGKYRTILNNAISADAVVREKYQSSRRGIEILCGTEADIASKLPAGSATSALKDSAVVQELRSHMSKVEAIKNEREVLENEIKNASSNDIANRFMQSGGSDPESIINTETDRIYNTLIQQVQESVKRQELLLNNIQDANTRFSNAKQQNVSAKERETVLRELASAYDVYMELTENLKEGTKFYNDLTGLLVKFQGKVNDLCFARKTEKEELLKDLTMAIANQPSEAPTAAPRQPPSRPPPPTNRPTAAAPTPASRPPATAPPPAMAPPPGQQGAQPYPVQPMPQYAPYGYQPMPQPFITYPPGAYAPPAQGGYAPPQQGYAPYPQQQYGNPYGTPGYYPPPRQ